MEFLKKLDLKSLLILGLIIVILLMRACSSTGNVNKGDQVKIDDKKYTIVKHTIDTIIKPVTQTVFKQGKTIYVDVPVYVNVPADVDTASILKDYYTKFPYKDTLRLDEGLGYVAVSDTIFKNKILNRKFYSHVNKVTVSETLYVQPVPKIQVFMGGVAGFDKVNFVNFVGPSLLIKDKKDKVYSVGVGYSNTKAISIQGGIYWLLKSKKQNGTN
jgi:hypothetical protein